MLLNLNESDVLIGIENFVEKVVLKEKCFRGFYNQLANALLDFSCIYNSDFYYSALLGPFIELVNDFEPYLDDNDLYDRLKDLYYSEIRRDFKKALSKT